MTFLHPLVLLGLAAAAIPALLHLLERRVPPEAEFPPLRYLSEEGLLRAAADGGGYCTACFTLDYPIVTRETEEATAAV